VPLVLLRVDERLIHGQVVLGWGSHLRPDRYIVVDDSLEGSDWEQDLYRLGAGDADALFVTVEEARERLPEWRSSQERSILLTRNVGTMLALARGGALEGESVNLGGLHHAPDRKQVLPYLHLSEDELRQLESLESEGVAVSARDLPDAARVSLKSLLGS
jgi:mannose/fructose/N-acetylgalactosamine-specific phosphotransferase system component IIB